MALARSAHPFHLDDLPDEHDCAQTTGSQSVGVACHTHARCVEHPRMAQ
jgi:hypothetical protein